MINEKSLVTDDPLLSTDYVIIYIVDGVFTTSTEVNEAISRHPDPPVNPLNTVDDYEILKVDDRQVQALALFAAMKILEKRHDGTPKSFSVTSATFHKFPGVLKFKISLEIESDHSELSCDVVIDDHNDRILNEHGESAITNTNILLEFNCKPMEVKKDEENEKQEDSDIKLEAGDLLSQD